MESHSFCVKKLEVFSSEGREITQVLESEGVLAWQDSFRGTFVCKSLESQFLPGLAEVAGGT